jgi:transposase
MKARKPGTPPSQLFQIVDMEALVPPDHILRQLQAAIDFSRVREWVDPLYAERGRPAVDPERVVKLVLLSYFFHHSERELFTLLPMHAGYLWFCGWNFEDAQRLADAPSPIPDRSTIVKTRQLWRRHGVFEKIMEHVVHQCIAAGLVKPDVHVGVDGTQVRANASIHSLQPIEVAPVVTLAEYLADLAQQDERECPARRSQADNLPPSSPPGPGASADRRASEADRTHEDFHGVKFSHATHRSVTDPDARLYKKGRGQEAHLRYLVHHVTDVHSGVILSAQASRATGTAERDVSLGQLVRLRMQYPQIRVRTVSADKAYGTPEYLEALFAQGIVPLVSLRSWEWEDVPVWKRRTEDPDRLHRRRQQVRAALVKNKVRRIQIQGRYRAIQKRRMRCEHGFAEAKGVHGLERARSRGLDCMHEQALWTAIVQNLKRLCRFKRRRPRPQTGVAVRAKPGMWEPVRVEAAAGLAAMQGEIARALSRLWGGACIQAALSPDF